MTNPTDSSPNATAMKQPFEKFEKLTHWLRQLALADKTISCHDWNDFLAELNGVCELAYRHLHPSPSPGGWIEIKPGCKMPETVEGKDYSENVFVICDGKLGVMSYGWVDAEPEGGWVWSNCYGDIRGDSEWDDEYKPTHWMPLPSLQGTRD